MQISPRYKRSFIEPPALSRRADEENRDDGPRVVFHRVSRDRQSIITVATLSLPRWHGAFEIIIDRSRAARGTGWTAHRSYLFLPSCIIKRNIDRGNVHDATRALPARRKFEFALVSHETRFRSRRKSLFFFFFFFCCCCNFFLSFFSFFLFLLIYLFIFFTKRFVGRFDSAYHASGIIKQRDNHIHARFFLQ